MKKSFPRLSSSRVCARLLEPHEAAMMARFRKENREHLEAWEPRRSSAFFTEDFWQLRLKQNIRDFRNDISACFVLLAPAEDEVLGVCNYTNIIRGTFQSCHLGYALGLKHQGRGLMYEALAMTNSYIFSELGIHRIQAGYLPHNRRSELLLQRLGFEKEGFAKRYLEINGKWEDHVLTSLVDEDD